MVNQQITQNLKAVGNFLFYAIKRFPLTRVVLGLTIFLLFLDYASLSLVIPLAASGGNINPSKVTLFWSALVGHIGLRPTISTWIWLFVMLLALRVVMGYVYLLLSSYVSKQVHFQLSKDVFEKVLIKEPMQKIYKRSIGFYISLAGDDTFRAGSLINSACLMLSGIFSACAGLFLLFLFSKNIFIDTIVFLLISGAIVGFGVKKMLAKNSQAIDLSREAGTNFLETLNGLRSLRSMVSEEYMLNVYAVQMKKYTRLLFLIEGLRGGFKFVPAVFALLLGTILLGPWFEGQIDLTPESIFAVTTILIRIFVALGGLMGSASQLLVDAKSAKDLGELISIHESKIHEDSVRMVTKKRPNFSRLELRSIRYTYDEEKLVLNDLGFHFEKGGSYAIIGPSGSGKSTVADLLLGLIEPNFGAIFMDGELCSGENMRGNVILAEQQPRIFSVTIRENLLMGLVVEEELVWAALEVVDMSVFVRSLPRKLDTVLEYQGANLSGGQRQRLAIARALLRNPSVLILDEGTSALDPNTRDQIVQRIKLRLKDDILIFITHDESIAELVDAILEIRTT